MPVNFDPKAAEAELDRRVGQLLVVCAVEAQSELKRELSHTGPPSVPGEFPKLVTGNLRESIVYEPTDPAEAGRKGSVRVGYSQAGFYGGILEWLRGRLGVRDVVKRLRGRINARLGKP